nr:transposon protein, putative, CACTA, En/Spm sub-class [Triticum aestivum]
MKSHNCHVLMTQILLVAIRGIMDTHVRETLFGLCNFFDIISRKSIGVRQLRRLQEKIVVILCELEMYFLPAFFDVMVHLLVHIMEDIIQLGPTFLHSMMSFERMNGVIKGYVRNMSRPEGSIARGFLTEECISYCTNYLGIENPVGLPVNRHLGRLAGWGHHVVDPWVVEHKTFIEKTYNDRGQRRTDGDILKEHNSCFMRWFKQKLLSYPLHEDSSVEEQLIFALSQGAEHNLRTYEAYDINGYTFYTEDNDMKSDGYQNSGVTMESYTGKDKDRYYGRIEEISELSYAGEMVPMFRVRWAKSVLNEDRYFTKMVIPEAKSKTAGANVTAKNEPWVPASQVDQCFFITDPPKPSRVVVRRGKRKIIGMDGVANEQDFDKYGDPKIEHDDDDEVAAHTTRRSRTTLPKGRPFHRRTPFAKKKGKKIVNR